jgi:nitroreductase
MTITYPNPVDYKVIEPIAKRFSPRAFLNKSIDAKTLMTLFEAARWSASSYNEQPSRFIVVTKDKPEIYNQMLSCANEWNQTWAKLAPVLVLTIAKKDFSHNDKPNRHAWYDLGAAVSALSLEAAAHEIYLHQMAGIDAAKAQEVFKVPDSYDVVSMLAVGYLGEIKDLPEAFHKGETRERIRKPLSELVFEDSFGEAKVLS